MAAQILPGSTINLASRENPHDSSDERLVEFDSNERSFTIRDYSRRVRERTGRYWSLPTQFLGNKVLLFFLSSFFLAGRVFSPALRPYMIGPMRSPDIQNLLEAFASIKRENLLEAFASLKRDLQWSKPLV